MGRMATPSPDASEPRGRVRLDEVSKQIIEHLQVDGRQSYATIAREVGLSEAAVRQRATKMLEAAYVVTTAGSFDVLVEMVCEDDEQLLELLTTRLRTIPGVRSTETFVYLRLDKQHYDWGTR